MILVVNKTDRPDARITDVVHEATDLLLGLASDLHEDVPDLDLDAILDVPVVFAAAKAGRASLNQPADGGLPDSENLEPLFKTILERIPAPTYTEGAPLQAHVTNLDASPFLGRLALLRVFNGTIRKGQTVAWAKADGTLANVKITELLETKALERVSTDSAGPGDIVAVAGIENITIGETLTDPDDPRPLPLITVDDPAISMTIGINTSPLAGRGGKGHKVTARQVKDRLDKELVGNVSLRVLPTERPDAWEVQGRGELALAILVEQMRREGFELTVGKPQVVTKKVDGKVARARRADDHRRPRGVPRRRDAAARAAQGPHGDHVEPRHRLGPHGVPGPRAWPHRLPHAVPHGHPRHRHRVVDLRGLRAVGRPDRDPHQRLARRRPLGSRHAVRDDQPAGARLVLRPADAGGLRGPDRR